MSASTAGEPNPDRNRPASRAYGMGRRVPSIEDYDFIGARLAELEAERKAAEAKGE